MKLPILCAVLTASMFAQNPPVPKLIQEMSYGPIPDEQARRASQRADEIRSEVIHAIAAEPAYASTAVSPIHVTVRNTVVTLRGIVDSDSAAAQADIAAGSVPAVSKVINHLRVAPPKSSLP